MADATDSSIDENNVDRHLYSLVQRYKLAHHLTELDQMMDVEREENDEGGEEEEEEDLNNNVWADEGEKKGKKEDRAPTPSPSSFSAVTKRPCHSNKGVSYYLSIEPARTSRLPDLLANPNRLKPQRRMIPPRRRALKLPAVKDMVENDDEDEYVEDEEEKDWKRDSNHHNDEEETVANAELKRLKSYMDSLDRRKGLSVDLQICLLDCHDDIKVELIHKNNELQTSPINEKSKLQSWLTLALSLPYQKQAQLPVCVQITNDPERTVQKTNQAIGDYLRDVSKQLDIAVFGHQQAKKDIVSFIASLVRRNMAISNPSTQAINRKHKRGATGSSRTLAICGPAGVGKTTLAHTIADVLGLPFHAINCGGLNDAHSLMGHNFTYANSRPGKIAKAMSQAAASNMVFYFDEVDKIGAEKADEMHGVLTHILDVEQNHRFMDSYLDPIPLDLSNALFILSFNDAKKIDEITKDRMKIIHVKDFSNAEKLEITKEYILPNLYQAMQFYPMEVQLEDEILHQLIRRYEGHSGLRKVRRACQEILERWNLYHLLNQSHRNDDATNQISITWEEVEKHNLLDANSSPQEDTTSYQHMYS